MNNFGWSSLLIVHILIATEKLALNPHSIVGLSCFDEFVDHSEVTFFTSLTAAFF
jgi:hypothetical protein